MKKVYLICPVRKATEDQLRDMTEYVNTLERSGRFKVHFPPRDVDQSNDDGGQRICYEHREAMMDCDEVHIWWAQGSTGSHFDLGMAYMLAMFKEVHFVNSDGFDSVAEKSFQNVAASLCKNSSVAEMHESAAPRGPHLDSGEQFLGELGGIASDDVKGLRKAFQAYGPSWKSRGGVGAFMMLARKWDRLENRLKKPDVNYDIFNGIFTDTRGEGLIDDVRDLRRYLLLVESEVVARGFKAEHRDNKANA